MFMKDAYFVLIDDKYNKVDVFVWHILGKQWMDSQLESNDWLYKSIRNSICLYGVSTRHYDDDDEQVQNDKAKKSIKSILFTSPICTFELKLWSIRV